MGTRYYAVASSKEYSTNPLTEQPRVIKPLRRFDLKKGDKVSVREWTGEREVLGPGRAGDCIMRTRFYTILDVYEHVFLCVDRLGIKTSFMKKEYQLGEVQKVDSL